MKTPRPPGRVIHSPSDVWSLGYEAFREWQLCNPTMLAGGLSYFTLLALSPLIIMIFAVFGRWVDAPLILGRLDDIFGGPIAEVVTPWVMSPRTGHIHTVKFLGLFLLAYSASRTFVQLQASLNLIWRVPRRSKTAIHFLWQHTFFSVVMVTSAWLLILSLMLLNTGVDFASNLGMHWLQSPIRGFWHFIGRIITGGLFAVIFSSIYKWMPQTSVRWRDVWVGGSVAAILFMIARVGLKIYFAGHTLKRVYGTAGSVVIVMVWVYICAQIFFYGAVLSRVYADRRKGYSI